MMNIKKLAIELGTVFAYIIILIVPTACLTPESTPTDISPVTIANPAAVYCEQNGNQLEIRIAADGSQSGVCIFSDGSTCDEWAYYWGECGPATLAMTAEAPANNPGSVLSPGISEAITNWWGVIKRTEPGAQYDDYFERWDLGQVTYLGIDSVDPAVKSQIEELRDSGRIVHLYGILVSNVPDYNGSQILVERIEVDK